MRNNLVSIKRIIENEVGHPIDTKTRFRRHTYARAIFCKVAREMSGSKRPVSLQEIGAVIDRDHATVLHNINVVFPFAIQDTSFNILYQTLRAIFVDKNKSNDTFDRVKELGEKIVELEKENHSLKYKLSLVKKGSDIFDKMVDGLSQEEIDEVAEKMSIFVRAIKTRVYA